MFAFLRQPEYKPAETGPEADARYRRLRWQVFLGAFVGYAGFYLVRKNLSMAIPEMEPLGFAKAELGFVLGLNAAGYAFSKFLMGSVSDRSNARVFLPLGLVLSAIAMCFMIVPVKFIGVEHKTLAIVVMGVLNALVGWFNGMGWPPCGRVMTHWFSQNERGTMMSIWNCAHNVGGGLVGPMATYGAVWFGSWLYGTHEEFYFLAGADSHLANRNNDLVQFSKGFIERLKEEKAIAEEASVPIYSTILGDNAWDSYWYGNNYNLKNYRATLAEYGYALPFFPCMGNHDNDGATPCDENTDFEASAPFRKIMAPNYYSFNIGKVHFVILDDIFYINSGDPSGTACVGSRNYKGHIPGYELEWLRKDLQDVDHDTPVILGMHIPVWMRHTSVLDSCYAYLTYNEYNSSVDLAEILSDYSKVHIITGHTHWNHHAHPAGYPNIHENNIAAVCAIWWYTGNKTGWHNCRDGVPGGYEMFHINGKDITWKYHSIEKNGNAQFHVLDINTVKQSYQNNENKVINLIEKYPSYSYTASHSRQRAYI